MRKILLTSGLLIICMSLFAQEIAISVDAPPTVVAGQGFRMVYSVNSTDGRFQPPVFDRSFTVTGPQTSTSRNVQWIDGEVSTVATTTLIYYVVASETGKFTVPAAQYITKKLTVESAPAVIEVVSDGAAVAGAAGASGSVGSGTGQAQSQTGQSSSAGAEVSLRLIMSD